MSRPQAVTTCAYLFGHRGDTCYDTCYLLVTTDDLLTTRNSQPTTYVLRRQLPYTATCPGDAAHEFWEAEEGGCFRLTDETALPTRNAPPAALRRKGPKSPFVFSFWSWPPQLPRTRVFFQSPFYHHDAIAQINPFLLHCGEEDYKIKQ